MLCHEVREEVVKQVDTNLYLFCEVCFEKIGIVDKDNLYKPMKGNMFKSFDPAHGRPTPFYPEADWLDLKCPYCRRRAMYEPDSITTQHGILRVYTQKKKESIELKLAEKIQKESEIVEYLPIESEKDLNIGDEVTFHGIPAKYIMSGKKRNDKDFVVIQYTDGKKQHVKPSILKKKYVHTTSSTDDTKQ
jgi:hypothetical protein